ncbi:MAG: ATP-binding protein [Treponema sp.]|nr:ATP-binding protein [Treponema sp.]
MIRNLEEPWIGSIDDIYHIKAIFEDVTGIKIDVETGNIRHSYSKVINIILAKILQEAFTNSIRHGKASRILIHFWELSDELTMTVTDNGIGSKTIVKRIGLAGMEERLAAVGGTIEVTSPEEGGFRIRVRIPINAAEEDENVLLEEIVNGRTGTEYSLGR